MHWLWSGKHVIANSLSGLAEQTASLVTGVGLAGEAGLPGSSPTRGPGAARHVPGLCADRMETRLNILERERVRANSSTDHERKTISVSEILIAAATTVATILMTCGVIAAIVLLTTFMKDRPPMKRPLVTPTPTAPYWSMGVI